MTDQPEDPNGGTHPPAPGREQPSGGVLPHASGAGEPVGGVLRPTGASYPPPADEQLPPAPLPPSVMNDPDPVPPAPPEVMNDPGHLPPPIELPAARTEMPPPGYPNYINPDAGLAPADDPDDLPLPKGRAPASTRYLGVAVALALAFGGGVLAQKHHDKGYTPPVSGPAAAMAAGLAAGAGGGAGGAGAAGGGAPGTVTFTPKIVGTITAVSGSDITVMGSDGVKHLVHTNAQTVVLRKGAVADIKPGTVVAVDGSADDAGVLTSKGIIAQ